MAIIGLLIGAFAITVVPPVSTYDAPSHYFRADLLREGTFAQFDIRIGNSEVTYPSDMGVLLTRSGQITGISVDS